MSERYYPGDNVRVPLTVRTPDGALADPDSAILSVISPSGAVQTFDSTVGAVARLGLGQYQVSFTVTEAGRWLLSWVTSDPLPGIDEFDLIVQPRQAVAATPLTLSDLSDLARVATDGWNELAQRACRNARITGDMLRIVATGANTDALGADLLALAEQGVALLTDQLGRASKYAANYVATRYPAGLTPEQLATSDLPTAVATIALRRLYGTAIPKDVADGTAWADKYLRDLATGTISLGQADAVAATEETYHSFSPRSVTDDSLRGFA